MTQSDRDSLLSRGMTVTVVVLIFGGLFMCARYGCNAKWRYSGMATSWGPVQGCLVEVQPGRWMPEERVREVDLAPRE